MQTLQLDPRTVFLTDTDVLYILNARGTFELRARHIDQLHRRLQPWLDGRFGEDALLAALGDAQRPALKAYLNRLLETGALRTAPLAELPLPTLEDMCAEASFQFDGQRIRLSTQGFQARSLGANAVALCFMTPREADHVLREAQRLLRYETTVILVVTPVVEPIVARRIAAWLLQHEQMLDWPRRHLCLYRLAPGEGLLTRVLRLSMERPSDLRSLPMHLGWLEVSPLDQVPLLSAQANAAFVATPLLQYGLHRAAVHEALLYRMVLEAAVAAGRARPGLAVAPSRAHLRLRLLEDQATRHAAAKPPPSTPCDLLALPSGHPDVLHLQGLMRLYRTRLPARRAVLPSGLTFIEAEGVVQCGCLPEQVLARVLLALVARQYYGSALADGMGTLPYAHFATDARSRACLRHFQSSAMVPSVPLHRISSWGVGAWVAACP
jgi:hypothetical protein